MTSPCNKLSLAVPVTSAKAGKARISQRTNIPAAIAAFLILSSCSLSTFYFSNRSTYY
jgi:hypothetical protein